MKPHELRVGNLIHFNGKDTTVTEIRTNELLELGYYGSVSVKVFLTDTHYTYESPWLAKCSPIPLTEEWLLKFGFEQHPISWMKNISYFPKEEFKGLCVTLSQGILIRGGLLTDPRESDEITVLINTDIHGPLYVHQLQNLYFALTGKELEPTPSTV